MYRTLQPLIGYIKLIFPWKSRLLKNLCSELDKCCTVVTEPFHEFFLGNILTSHQYKRVFPQDWELRFALADIMCMYSVAWTHSRLTRFFRAAIMSPHLSMCSSPYPTHYKFGKIWGSDSELSGRAELILDITPENMAKGPEGGC